MKEEGKGLGQKKLASQKSSVGNIPSLTEQGFEQL
jgi:hypothetical protein